MKLLLPLATHLEKNPVSNELQRPGYPFQALDIETDQADGPPVVPEELASSPWIAAGHIGLLRRFDHGLIGVGKTDQNRAAFLVVYGRGHGPDLIGPVSQSPHMTDLVVLSHNKPWTL